MRLFFLSIVLTASLMFTSSFGNDKDSKNVEDPKPRIEVFFNASAGFTELVMIKADLETKGIILDYKKIEYNKQGELISLSFSVDCRDGFSGSASTDNLKNNVRFGFYRDYSRDAKSPFGTGGITK